MDVHFSLTTERHDKAAHCLLSELGLVLGVPHDQVVPRDAIHYLLSVLLEDLTFLELLDICDHHSLILNELDALF